MVCGKEFKLFRTTDKHCSLSCKAKDKKNGRVLPSKKDTAIKRELIEVKKGIDQKAMDEDMYYCWGCGNGSTGLDHSHILGVGQRKDLELDPENMNLFDRTCHDAWESGDIMRMLDLNTFEKDLEYIEVNDDKRYWDIIEKIHKLDLDPEEVSISKIVGYKKAMRVLSKMNNN